MHFEPSLFSTWEIPTGWEHCYGASCEDHPIGTTSEDAGEEWLLFSPHNLDSVYFPTDGDAFPDHSLGGTWDGRLYVSHYHGGLWVVDVETLIHAGLTGQDRNDTNMDATIGFYLPHGSEYGEQLDSQYYDFGWIPFLWAAEYHDGYTYMSCITSGLYVVQLDIDEPYEGVLMNNG